MDKIKLEIPRISNDSINLTLKNGDQFFIVGPNGSGKSALIHRIVSMNTDKKIKRISAHRQTWLSSGSINFTPESREAYEKTSLQYITQNEARWRDSNAGQDLSAILFDLVAKENTRARLIAQHVDNQDLDKAQTISGKSPSPFYQINQLLKHSTLKVTLENSNDRTLLARHPQGEPFSIAEMSDAERSAVIIASHVIIAESGTVFLIDEPERHLHRSISEPFLSALFQLRREECTFIVSTHEISLPVANPEARVLMLRSCQWSNNQCVAWDAEILEPNSSVPEDLKLAILGSRNRILFVEGTPTASLDCPLYRALFPGLSVLPKGSCEDVQKAVLGLRDSQELHHIEAFGLIDRDNRKNEDVKKLEEKGVFALEVYEVEALYYCSDAIKAVAYEQARLRRQDGNTLIESAKKGALEVLKSHGEEMAAKRSERQAKDAMSKNLNWKTIMNNPTQPIEISINLPFTDELNRFNKLIEDGNLDKLVARYPVDDSCALETIAKSLKCQNKTDYESIVINLIRGDKGLAKKLKMRVGPLSETLDQVEDPETI